ncbi:hypothetical protein PG593_11090, partial [Riemerella anatipestifer]|nr:hypothetical protein [Riemerella anatipestifer]
KPFYILFVRFGFSFFYNAKIQLYFGSVIFSSVACNGRVLPKAGLFSTQLQTKYNTSKVNKFF